MSTRLRVGIVQVLLLGTGFCGVAYYLYALNDQYAYQSYQSWALDQQLRDHKQAPHAVADRPSHSDVLGRVEIPRLKLATIVREGVDAKTLSVSAGHVPSTSLPNQPGNFAIAAHRDTLFRAIRNIRKGDVVNFRSLGGTYSYEVEATKIVDPSDVSVLEPNGGGIIPVSKHAAMRLDGDHLLTLITCYPFYYIGPAPRRFIVEAQMIKTGGS